MSNNSKSIKIIGIDPSFRNFGTARCTYDRNTTELTVESLRLISPPVIETSAIKKRNLDDLRRATHLYEGLLSVCEGMDLAVVEVPVGSQSARASVSYGVCIGILAACPIPITVVTPIQVKKAGAGHREASKKDMIDWATTVYPDANWLMKGNKYLNANEHLADALAAIKAAIFHNLI